MATLTEVRLRIQGVRNTQKITRAMKIVAATKLRKNERLQRALKPYAKGLESLLQEVAVYSRPDAHPLLVPKKSVKRVGFIIVASDRGLCGAFNGNLFRRAQGLFEEERKKGREVVLYILGLKALRYFARHAYQVMYNRTRVEKEAKRDLVKEFITHITNDFLKNEIDECRLIYNEFRTVGSFGFASKQLLPVRLEGAQKKDVESIYENSYSEVLGKALPLYMENILLSALLESMTAEEASRMVAMDYATENAKTLVGDLTLFYNRTRQAVITKEISEIVGGAEALRRA
jgi:F-type H+-transporting ATPase subunit gamma